MIERKYIRLRKDAVAEYRRIKTPFFYINLKPKEYTHYDYKSPFLHMCMFGSYLLPRGMTARHHGWKDGKKNHVFNKELEKLLDVANETIEDNVLRMKA